MFNDIYEQKVAYDKNVMEAIWGFSPEPSEISEEVAKKIFYYLYDKNRNISSTGTYLEKELKSNLKDISTFSQNNLEMSKKLLKESFEKFEQTSKEHYKTYKKMAFLNNRQQLENLIKSQNPNLNEKISLWKHIQKLPIWNSLKLSLHNARRVFNDFTHKIDFMPTLADEKIVSQALQDVSNQFKIPLNRDSDFKFDLEIPKLEKLTSENNHKLKLHKKELLNIKSDLAKLDNIKVELDKSQILVKNKRTKKLKTDSVNPEKVKLLNSTISLLEKNISETSSYLESVKIELENISNLKIAFLPLQKQFLENQKYFDNYYQKLKEISKIFGDISNLAGLGWDLSQGILQSKEWLNLAKFSKLLEQKETLKKLVETLGRMKYSNEDFDMENILYKEIVVEKKRILSSTAKDEVVGIHQSSNINLILPSEISNLANPETEMLFYSKFLEEKLLTYDLQGFEDKTSKKEIEKEREEKKRKKQKGPIIINIDTSGSMHGTPEEVAKALTLAMVKIALKENRECYLITFSSVNQVVEYELTKGNSALNSLINFLMYSFGGGTDFETPLKRSLEILEKDNFSKADILMITDGYAGITSELSETLQKAKKENDFKITTVIVGSSISEDKFSDKIINFQSSF